MKRIDLMAVIRLIVFLAILAFVIIAFVNTYNFIFSSL